MTTPTERANAAFPGDPGRSISILTARQLAAVMVGEAVREVKAPHLFVDGEFTAHSGEILPFKIDCDALSDGDIATLAADIARDYKFSSVIGVPRGGLRLQEALKPYTSPGHGVLIVDDVLTTGRSMEEYRQRFHGKIQGVVIFARGPCPDWVTPRFTIQPDATIARLQQERDMWWKDSLAAQDRHIATLKERDAAIARNNATAVSLHHALEVGKRLEGELDIATREIEVLRAEVGRVKALQNALNYVIDSTHLGGDGLWHFRRGYDPQVALDATPARQENIDEAQLDKFEEAVAYMNDPNLEDKIAAGYPSLGSARVAEQAWYLGEADYKGKQTGSLDEWRKLHVAFALDRAIASSAKEAATATGEVEALREEVGRLQDALSEVMRYYPTSQDAFPLHAVLARLAPAQPSADDELDREAAEIADDMIAHGTEIDRSMRAEQSSTDDVERARQIPGLFNDLQRSGVAAALTAAYARGRAEMREIPYQNLLTAIGVACRCGPVPATITISVQAFHDELAKHGFLIRALPGAAQKEHRK